MYCSHTCYDQVNNSCIQSYFLSIKQVAKLNAFIGVFQLENQADTTRVLLKQITPWVRLCQWYGVELLVGSAGGSQSCGLCYILRVIYHFGCFKHKIKHPIMDFDYKYMNYEYRDKIKFSNRIYIYLYQVRYILWINESKTGA